MDRLARSGKRGGYTLLGVALAVFVVGAATSFTPVVVALVVGALAVGSVLLLPAIVVGYGVRAAEREDREGGAGRVR
jgi:ABC-type Na+ efflux pump permease subunit